MKISTKGQYGLRAMLDLALYSTKEHISLGSIAERQNISANYLEHVFSSLRKAGLINSIKGPQGGYILGKDANNITVGEILRVLEGELFQAGEDIGAEQNKIEHCLKVAVWDKMQTVIDKFVDSITLEDLLEEYQEMNNATAYMFYI